MSNIIASNEAICKMKTKAFFFVLFIIFCLKANAQCAMCRAVLESEASQSAAKGINDGIVYLMAIPYILVAAIGYLIYKKFNKSTSKLNK